VRSGEKPHFLVVTDGGSIDGGAGGELADFHVGSPERVLAEGKSWRDKLAATNGQRREGAAVLRPYKSSLAPQSLMSDTP
jgi:hypothetical protein